MPKLIFGLLLTVILSIGTIQPLFANGFFPMHDDTQIARVIEMGKALKNGQFPVRWVSDLGYGYGYPIFNFYGPLPYYFGGWLYSMGLDSLVATKLMFGFGIICAAVTMYLFSSRLFGITYGILAAIFYVYAPYHAVQIYVRGSVGEFWALGFFPIVALGFTELGYRKYSRAVLYFMVGLAGIILSHTLLGYISTLIIIFITILVAVMSFLHKNYTLLIYLIIGLIVGLSLSAFFWLPAISEMKFTNVSSQVGGGADYRNHFVCLSQLWNSPWGFGGSTAGCNDGMSFKIGKINLTFFLIAFILEVYYFLKHQKFRHQVVFYFIFIIIISIFMLVSWSGNIWRIIPGLIYLQYPWRFLTYSIFGISLFSAMIVLSIQNKVHRFIISAGIIFLCIFFNSKMFLPQYTYLKQSSDYASDYELKFRASKISDEYLPPNSPIPKTENDILGKPIIEASNNTRIEYIVTKDTYMKFMLYNNQSQEFVFRQVYFPGWKYYIDGNEIKPRLVNNLPIIPISKYPSLFEAKFTDTSVRIIGNLVSLATLFIILYIYGKKAHT
jgi:hypothetical protein